MPNLVIAGVPCSGKSTFGAWLERNQNFYHVDAELPAPSALDRFNLRLPWDRLVLGDPCEFKAGLARLDRPIVFDWGFPMGFLHVIRTLQSIGLSCWWFEADLDQARAAYMARSRGTVGELDAQIGGIGAYRLELAKLFGENTILTLNAKADRLPPERVWQVIRSAVS